MAGSEIHPTRMLEAFGDLGYDVDVVAGFGRQRRIAMRHVLDRLRSGHRYEFVYSEASTIPTALNDPRHLPLHPFADWRFLATMKSNRVPVGLFYPDVHWMFPFYDELTSPARAFVARRFYRFDLWWYRRVLSTLFLPSGPMSAWIPGWEQSDRVHALAPGGSADLLPVEESGDLRLFYVGSIAPPIYDITPLIDAVLAVDDVELTICCPVQQRGLLPSRGLPDRIRTVHESGPAVRRRYGEADLSCLVYGPETYRSFAMPVKLFESIGFGRPVLATNDCVAADFVEETGLGWSVSNDALVDCLVRLRDDRGEVRTVQERVRNEVAMHSWLRRAEQVAEQLRGVPGRPG